jgi:hypothetical protein
MTTTNTVVDVKARGAMETGICVHGPLMGKRVVRMSKAAPWMPAGDATADEMRQAAPFSTAFGDIFKRWGVGDVE